ncbi:hypothetical protein [Jannaschia sp. R86511]|uniref:hypothetical protein n=1 Tax=Jannaschia sp. R86511 TaxID=3093853 RepID=UPI0036D28E21
MSDVAGDHAAMVRCVRGRGAGFDERLVAALLDGTAGLRLVQPLTWREGPTCVYAIAALASSSGRALDLRAQVCEVSWSVSILDRVSGTRLVSLCGTRGHLNRRDGRRWPGAHLHVWTAEYGDNDARAVSWRVPDAVSRETYRDVVEGFCEALLITRDAKYGWTEPPQETPATTTDGSVT